MRSAGGGEERRCEILECVMGVDRVWIALGGLHPQPSIIASSKSSLTSPQVSKKKLRGGTTSANRASERSNGFELTSP